MNSLSPANPQYKHKTKGGLYELLGESTRAGNDLRGEMILVYRDVNTRQMFHRSPMAFADAMNPLPVTQGATGNYKFSEYALGQWWLNDLATISSLEVPSKAAVRAAGVAINFANAAFREVAALRAELEKVKEDRRQEILVKDALAKQLEDYKALSWRQQQSTGRPGAKEGW
jgi:hypothetical protein